MSSIDIIYGEIMRKLADPQAPTSGYGSLRLEIAINPNLIWSKILPLSRSDNPEHRNAAARVLDLEPSALYSACPSLYVDTLVLLAPGQDANWLLGVLRKPVDGEPLASKASSMEPRQFIAFIKGLDQGIRDQILDLDGVENSLRQAATVYSSWTADFLHMIEQKAISRRTRPSRPGNKEPEPS